MRAIQKIAAKMNALDAISRHLDDRLYAEKATKASESKQYDKEEKMLELITFASDMD
jgi:hypothetical protein